LFIGIRTIVIVVVITIILISATVPTTPTTTTTTATTIVIINIVIIIYDDQGIGLNQFTVWAQRLRLDNGTDLNLLQAFQAAAPVARWQQDRRGATRLPAKEPH
jgi:hypothetical protein